jgi:hypothetical protein
LIFCNFGLEEIDENKRKNADLAVRVLASFEFLMAVAARLKSFPFKAAMTGLTGAPFDLC